MTTVESEFRAVNVGRLGISGYHDRAFQMLPVATIPAIWAGAIWAWVATLPPNLEIYRISPHITVALLLKLCLACWTARIGWDFLIGFWACVRWLLLERQGMQWLRRNDHNFRVTYYRPGDGSLKFDQATRAQRLDHELQVIEFRKDTLIGGALRFSILALAYAVLPRIYVFSFELMNDGVHAFLERWHFVHYARLFLFYYFIVPAAVRCVFQLLEWLTYSAGAQFIPGAKLFDPVIPDKTLETLRAERTHGMANFVPPHLASKQLGS